MANQFAKIGYTAAQLTATVAQLVQNLTSHTSSTSNPHSVTKTQVGLGNVDNTSDVNKPVSTATKNYVDTNGGKINKIKVNNVTQAITDKTVNVTVPTKISDLTDDSDFATENYVDDGLAAKADLNHTHTVAKAETEIDIYNIPMVCEDYDMTTSTQVYPEPQPDGTYTYTLPVGYYSETISFGELGNTVGGEFYATYAEIIINGVSHTFSTSYTMPNTLLTQPVFLFATAVPKVSVKIWGQEGSNGFMSEAQAGKLDKAVDRGYVDTELAKKANKDSLHQITSFTNFISAGNTENQITVTSSRLMRKLNIIGLTLTVAWVNHTTGSLVKTYTGAISQDAGSPFTIISNYDFVLTYNQTTHILSATYSSDTTYDLRIYVSQNNYNNFLYEDTLYERLSEAVISLGGTL